MTTLLAVLFELVRFARKTLAGALSGSLWRTIARVVLLALAAGCGVCALFVLGASDIRWPSGPSWASNLRSLADLAIGLTMLGVSAAGCLLNARRIGRGETPWRAAAALCGGVGSFVALLAAWYIGEFAVGLIVDPIRTSDQNWLADVAFTPFLAVIGVGGWLLLALCFGDRPPTAETSVRLTIVTLAAAAFGAGLAGLAAATQAEKAGEALVIAAPLTLGLLGLSAALALRPKNGWGSALQAFAGYLVSGLCASVLSISIVGFFTAYDPRAVFLLGVVMIPVGFALIGGYGAGVLLAAGRARAYLGHLRRAVA